MSSAETILRVDQLSVVFHTYAGIVQAVRGVSLSLKKGEVLAVVGESGSGKSVTAQAIMGLTPIPPGEIRGGTGTYGGTEMVRATPDGLARGRGAGMSMIFQDPMTSLKPGVESVTAEFYDDRNHPYTLGLLNAVRRLTDRGDRPLRTIDGLPPLLIDPPDACAFASRCPFVMRICRQQDPGYFSPVPDNRVACWLHHEQAAARRESFMAARETA